MTLAIWASLAGTLVALLSETTAQAALGALPTATLSVAALVLVLLHAWYPRGVAHGHHRNLQYALDASRRMATMLGLTVEPDPAKPEPSRTESSLHEPEYRLFDWARGVELGISLLLAAPIVAIKLYL